MPMGITRVAEQYGLLAESSAHREALASIEAQARALAATQRGHGITPGMNDPRRLQHFAAKGDFGGKKAPPFGSKPDDEDDDEKDDKPWHEAGYGADDIDRANYHYRQYGADDVPDDERSQESGYDPSGDWQDHRRTPIGPMVVGAMDYDDPPEFEHRAPRGAFGDSDELEPADFGYGDEAYSDHDDDFGDDFQGPSGVGTPEDEWEQELLSPYQPAPAEHPGPGWAPGGKNRNPWTGGGWESGLDRPFVGAIDYSNDPDHIQSEVPETTVDPAYSGSEFYARRYADIAGEDLAGVDAPGTPDLNGAATQAAPLGGLPGMSGGGYALKAPGNDLAAPFDVAMNALGWNQ